MRLLVDIGNTRAKWRFEQSGVMIAEAAHLHADPAFAATLRGTWRQMPRPEEVIMASVGPARAREALFQVLRDAFGAVPVREAQTLAALAGLSIAYANPMRLGVDRFLALLAAHRREARDQLVVGVGTALTVDALDAKGCHKGGLIAPGPALMQRSLIDATAGIRLESPGAIVDLAADTADAVTSGTWHAAAGLIERIVARAHRWARTGPAIVLTGGDAPRLSELLARPVDLAPDLVLDGLALWADATAYPSTEDLKCESR